MGPVPQASALAWIAWADQVCGDLRGDPSSGSSCAPLLLGAGGYLQRWKRSHLSAGGIFRWHAEVDPDELEYLIHGLLRLESQVAVEVQDSGQSSPPDEGREFYLVLVRDVLHALELEGTGRAAFVDQLRCGWPVAAETS